MRAAQQAACAAIANAAPQRKLHVISKELGISVDRLAEGRKNWSEWVGGGRESIMDLRGKIRSDEAWIEFAVSVWKDNTRRSERAKDSIRNPNDMSDKRLYRINWLEVRIQDIYNLIVAEGKRKFDRAAVAAVPATDSTPGVDAVEAVEFHWSWWYTTKVRPFFVKDGGREVCVCVYNLRWDLFVESIYNYTKRLRGNLKRCDCQHTNHKSSIDFRREHTCTRQSSERFDEVACVTNTCSTCKDLSLFKVCRCKPAAELPSINQVSKLGKDGLWAAPPSTPCRCTLVLLHAE